ncbi:MAG: hypothetical protein PXX83_09400 [Candidatus Nitrosotalea sp.]|nr:hypothetical protein [Candidatus Nitrosotalea sp.]
MKTLHLSIVFGSGIAAVVAVGIYILIFPSSIASNYDSPSCNPAPNTSRDEIALKKITWLSVMEIEKNQTKLDCTSLTDETLSSLPKLEQSLNGADQCKQGKDNICSFPSGIGMIMISDGIIPVEDQVNYQASLTQDEAHVLLDNVNLASNGNLVVGDVKYDSKYYQIILFSSDKPGSSQVYPRFNPEPGYTRDNLAKGESINYTITLQTLATFGGPVKVELDPKISTLDSGLDAKIVPNILFIPERTSVNATMVVTAGQNVQNGIYDIGFSGKVSNGGFSGGMIQTECPCIRIGNSDWTISTFESGGGYWGGKDPPSWLRVETITDKQVYHIGDVVEIKNFIVNDSPNKVRLDNEPRLFVHVYNQVNGTGAYRYFYGIDAINDGKPIVLEPHSVTLIARPFYWDQSDLRIDSVLHKVVPGKYHVDMSFGSYNGTVWASDVSIVIK